MSELSDTIQNASTCTSTRAPFNTCIEIDNVISNETNNCDSLELANIPEVMTSVPLDVFPNITSSSVPRPPTNIAQSLGVSTIGQHSLLRELLVVLPSSTTASSLVNIAEENVMNNQQQEENGSLELSETNLPENIERRARKRKALEEYLIQYDATTSHDMAISNTSTEQQQQYPIHNTSDLQNSYVYDNIYDDEEAEIVLLKEPPELSKWEEYERRVKRLVNTLGRKSKTILKKQAEEKELFSFQIYVIKKTITQILLSVLAEYGSDKQYVHLLQHVEANESNNTNNHSTCADQSEEMVSLDTVYCSKCGGSDAPDNDILLCDGEGCGRAYHLKCQLPSIDATSIKEEPYWFCWVCHTTSNCFDIFNRKFDTDFDDVNELFPDLDDEASLWEGHTKYHTGFYDPESNNSIIPVVVLEQEETKPKRKYNKKKSLNDESDEEEEILLKKYKKFKKQSCDQQNDSAYVNWGRRGRKAHPLRPPPPDTAYILFQKKMLPELRLSFSHLDAMSRLGELWKDVPEEEKQEYITLAEISKQEYREKMINFHHFIKKTSSSSLKNHANKNSNNNTNSITMKLLECRICGKEFKSEGGLKYHSEKVCVVDLLPPPAQNITIQEGEEDEEDEIRSIVSEEHSAE